MKKLYFKLKTINKNNEIKSPIRERNYGIDFLKIFAMINIIVLHINLVSKELNYNYYSPKFRTVWLSEIMAYWGVNVFGIISGIVGYKKYKISNLIFLWFQTFFYSTTMSFYNYIKYNTEERKKRLALSFFPIYSGSHWYICAYFCMYPFLLIINNGINNISRVSFRNVLIIIICFYSIYDIIITIIFKKNDYNFLKLGYSPNWLIILYILGAYLRKYIIFSTKNIKIIFHIFWLLVYFCSSFFSYVTFIILLTKNKIYCRVFISYISPTILIQSISLILIFSRLNITNNIIKTIISFFTPLTFNVTLLHLRILKEKYFFSIKFGEYLKKLYPKFLFFKIYGLATLIYLLCAFIDYFRFILFKRLKIREFCLFLENKFPKLIEKMIDLC